jgi:hypothetical protein
MIPFFVMDRPNALRLLLRVSPECPAALGIMAHARVSRRFALELAQLRKSRSGLPKAKLRVIADSGAFARNSALLDEAALFDRYEQMGVDFGIVNDVLRDRTRTLVNSARAMGLYTRKRRPFQIVGVAQGRSLSEYLDCYQNLSRLGFQYIAVGGLLHKKPRSVRFTQVESKRHMHRVIMGIRKEFHPDWLYILGAYHPRRHALFQEWQVWGSDYKGWLLRYPSVFDGLKTLFRIVRGCKPAARLLHNISEAEHYLRVFRNSSIERRKRLRQILLSHHAALWRSRMIADLLAAPDLARQDRRIIRAVFWQTSEARRRAGIVRHLREEVFPLLNASRRPPLISSLRLKGPQWMQNP